MKSAKIGVYCKKHPTYKVIKSPTADCETCRVLWTLVYIGKAGTRETR